MKEYKYYQYVVIQLFTCPDSVVKIVSDNKITKEIVLQYLKDNYNYNTLLDDFEFIDKPTTIRL